MAEDDTQYSSTMSSVAHAIDTIHGLGMKVLLKPMLDVDDGTWRAFIDPSDKDQWFANYTNFIGTFADMAQSKGVELLSIGCEMNTLEKSTNNTRWTNLDCQHALALQRQTNLLGELGRDRAATSAAIRTSRGGTSSTTLASTRIFRSPVKTIRRSPD